MILGNAQGFTEALVVDDLPGSEELDGFTDIRILDQAQNVVVGGAGFLLRSHVFHQIGDGIALGLEFAGIEGNAAGGALSPLQACSYKMFYESSILSYASLRTRENKEIVKAVLTMFIQGATEIYKLQNNWYLSSQSRKYEIYQEFLKLVMKHYTIHHGTSFYADELGLSLPHFCSTIKKAAGNTPLEVIASVILMEAKSRLKSTDEPVKNIALSLGFNNISFFNKFFKQHTGITPQEYRGR